MNEKIIAKAEFKDVKFACMTLPVIMFLIYCINSYRASYQSWKDDYNFSYGFGFGNGANLILIPLIFLSILFGYFLYCRWSKLELIVTDKRVYGNDSLGKRVDLPIDSIAAVATSIFSGLAVTTPSGAIKFVMIQNRNEVHDAIRQLLIARQNAPAIVEQSTSPSTADELKKFKELFDLGIITQEEFDAKKKQLLGL